MDSVKYILRRFIGSSILISLLFIVLNIAGFLLFSYTIFVSEYSENLDTSDSREIKSNLIMIEDNLILKDGKFILDDSSKEVLHKNKIWAMLIDNNGDRVWGFDLPKEIPSHYTLTDVAKFSRFFLKDYPVYVWEHPNGILVTGYPKDKYTKFNLTYTIKEIEQFPMLIIGMFLVNAIVTFLIALFIGLKMVKSIKPIITGIKLMSKGEPVLLQEKGILSDISKSINTVSKELQMKDEKLRKKEEARSNWIAGISHDIRTPLSMIIGYAGELEESSSLSNREQEQVSIICNQGVKIRELVNDLNLVSKLEYNMQALNCDKIRVSAFLRELISEFINNNLDNDFYVELDILNEDIIIDADKKLLKRAISNLIQNSITHNQQGCIIRVTSKSDLDFCYIIVEDDGKGMSQEKINSLLKSQNGLSEAYTKGQNHGLGILIVAGIINAHRGKLDIMSIDSQGLKTILKLPLIK
ncbi:HAMP domain-containing histidine kinase [Clostridioides difficile]|uniref:sensor histidine kinase n=1 Tax=Clostridioides difficile TaxID=1496 RepID=UPI000D1DD6B8|nr:HAMP domain-containing sensor histidine kinase [Clostridioides difficile]MCM0736563.1 HAMP domain-containing histidine kinase [Clostridioides difficile]MCP8364397.1 HAMP domain-containing histidine kinase [Clostridioides difficile]MCP8366811.1 HAMP domain-containing histidine kinase [Clostridioides difficile]MCP8371321.1 HAMP domain-containing histidine kinase [Clostridioides difficile]MCP8377722.1 HAMP domain-containing histidine kinase [Clostridioides difficile]